jgi:hypothetical protein
VEGYGYGVGGMRDDPSPRNPAAQQPSTQSPSTPRRPTREMAARSNKKKEEEYQSDVDRDGKGNGCASAKHTLDRPPDGGGDRQASRRTDEWHPPKRPVSG